MNTLITKATNPTAAAVPTICRLPSIRTLPTPLTPTTGGVDPAGAEEFEAVPAGTPVGLLPLALVARVVLSPDPPDALGLDPLP